MKLDTAIDDVTKGESELATRLRTTGERHATEADLYHLGHTLAVQCAQRAERLAPFVQRYGASPREVTPESPRPFEAVRRRGAGLLRASEAPGFLLLRDLRKLYQSAQATELSWTILMQCARAVRDTDLVEVAAACREEAETVGKWVRTRVKELSPQVLATG